MLLSKFRVYGHSMEPTIKNGQSVLVLSYLFIKPRIKDVIAFKTENKVFIKRIAKYQNNKYFLIGDNLKDSLDSRSLGFIEKKDIIGKVLKIL
jgi:phage repressor protein C with HTH and peptisase S24 domain